MSEVDSTNPAYLTRLENRLDAERKARKQLEEDVDELRTYVKQLEAERDGLRDRVLALESQMDQLSGLADGEESTPAARARDLALALKNRAQTRSSGTAHMDYTDVKDTLTDQGHGTVYDQQAYRAMETAAAEVAGVSEGTFDEKQVVRFDLGAFDGEVAVND